MEAVTATACSMHSSCCTVDVSDLYDCIPNTQTAECRAAGAVQIQTVLRYVTLRVYRSLAAFHIPRILSTWELRNLTSEEHT